jgi:hypothetical protein
VKLFCVVGFTAIDLFGNETTHLQDKFSLWNIYYCPLQSLMTVFTSSVFIASLETVLHHKTTLRFDRTMLQYRFLV